MSDLINRLNDALEGRYRIERELGEGGMASVYLADDQRHDRKVALKVLKPELAAVVGGERFLAEIKTTANLHHPHILPLFDSGEADGFLFYVMPYVEGESLRERLERERQLPVETAVELARKVADALDYAHERGVVHRDVKPANILLSERGEPLVADFGIALAVRQAGGGRITETGLSLGTPHYMSPEQASGDQTVDRRTDVYALACVLYEMLAGEPPYAGTTSQAVLAKILTTDPGRVSEVRRAVPAHVDAAVAKALEKLPADRFGSAGAFGEALDDVSFRHALRPAHGAAGTGGSERRTGPLSRWSTVQVGSVATGLVAGALLTMAGFALLEPDGGSEARSGAIPTSRFVVELGGHTIRQSQFDLSADGRMFVYATEDDREPLYIRTMDDPEPRPIAGTEGADWPVFSPDGQWIAYRDDDALRRVAIEGGSPLRITTGISTPIPSPHWGEDGSLVFAQQDGLYRVAAQGGEPEKLLDGSQPFQLRFPRLLPGGEALLFTEVEGFAERGAVFLLDMESRETTPLIQEGLDARYVETGHIVYGHPGGSLFALPFDLESLEAIGDPVPVLDGVRVVPDVLATAFAASRIGTVAYLRGRGPGIAADILVMADSAGDWEPLPLESPLLWAPRFSPDGRRLAYEDQEQIRIHDVVLGTNLRITEEGRHNFPLWTPRGDSLVFASEIEGSDGFDLYVASADGEGEPRLLWSEEGSQYPESWDPEGSRLLYTSRSEDGNEDLEILHLDGEPEATPYLTADWDEYRGRISPDGRWVAYDSDEDGTNRIYVRAFPEPGAQWVVSEGAGESSRWSPDGETLYYWRGDTLVAARVRTEPSFQVLSRSDVLVGRYDEEYDVRPDGSGFVFSGPLAQGSDSAAGDEEEGDGSAELVIVVNWFDELTERAGVRRGGR